MDFFRRQTKKRVIDLHDPIPVGETQDSDWAAWEDSVAFQDSQMAGFAETAKMPLTPEDTHGIDVFASVGRNSA